MKRIVESEVDAHHSLSLLIIIIIIIIIIVIIMSLFIL